MSDGDIIDIVRYYWWWHHPHWQVRLVTWSKLLGITGDIIRIVRYYWWDHQHCFVWLVTSSVLLSKCEWCWYCQPWLVVNIVSIIRYDRRDPKHCHAWLCAIVSAVRDDWCHHFHQPSGRLPALDSLSYTFRDYKKTKVNHFLNCQERLIDEGNVKMWIDLSVKLFALLLITLNHCV